MGHLRRTRTRCLHMCHSWQIRMEQVVPRDRKPLARRPHLVWFRSYKPLGSKRLTLWRLLDGILPLRPVWVGSSRRAHYEQIQTFSKGTPWFVLLRDDLGPLR